MAKFAFATLLGYVVNATKLTSTIVDDETCCAKITCKYYSCPSGYAFNPAMKSDAQAQLASDDSRNATDHFIFVLDKSGSMSGHRWRALVDAYDRFILTRQQKNRVDLVVDSPGFEDSRGDDYDLVLGLSLDFAVRDARSILAIVFHVPYAVIANRRGHSFMESLRRLRNRFPEIVEPQARRKDPAGLHMVINNSCKLKQTEIDYIEDGEFAPICRIMKVAHPDPKDDTKTKESCFTVVPNLGRKGEQSSRQYDMRGNRGSADDEITLKDVRTYDRVLNVEDLNPKVSKTTKNEDAKEFYVHRLGTYGEYVRSAFTDICIITLVGVLLNRILTKYNRWHNDRSCKLSGGRADLWAIRWLFI